MSRGKRRYLLALVSNSGACWWCKKLLPGNGYVRFCGKQHHVLWMNRECESWL